MCVKCRLMAASAPVGPPNKDILETEIDGDISLYHPITEQVTVLNATASDIWRLADGERNADDIVSLLASAYEVGSAEIASDVYEAIAGFIEAGLIGSD